MPRLEDIVNRLTDIDAGWWPFLRLRPPASQRMDNRCLLRMALHYGPLFGALVYAWYVVIGFLPWSLVWALVCVAVGIAFFFLASKFTFAVYWNRRAERLQRQAQAHER